MEPMKATPTEKIIPLWFTVFLCIIGLFLPNLILSGLPKKNPWLATAVATHQLSISQNKWEAPWQPIPPLQSNAAWISCDNLNQAIELDRAVDDGFLFSGNLRFAEGGLCWLP